MTIPTTALSETSPAGSDNIALGDNRIREYKTQNREILEVDHKYESSGQHADMGKHKKVSLIEQADLGTGAVGLPILGAQTVSGKAELLFTDEDDNDIQLTSGGKLHAPVGGLSAGLKEAIFEFMYPVGTVITLGVSTNPNTLLGFGTWTAIAGKVIVGIDAGQTEFDTLNETGGAKTVTLTTTELPAHTHTVLINDSSGGSLNIPTFVTQGGTISADVNTSSTGSGAAFSIMNPYIVKYVWERTS